MGHGLENNNQGPANVHQKPHLYFLNNALMNKLSNTSAFVLFELQNTKLCLFQVAKGQ
jgi:hypothetical protein